MRCRPLSRAGGSYASKCSRPRTPSRWRWTVRENETLITTIKEHGILAFEVRFRDKQEKTLLVVIFDAETKPHALLGALYLPVDGKRIDTNTSPPFGVRVRRIEGAQ